MDSTLTSLVMLFRFDGFGFKTVFTYFNSPRFIFWSGILRLRNLSADVGSDVGPLLTCAPKIMRVVVDLYVQHIHSFAGNTKIDKYFQRHTLEQLIHNRVKNLDPFGNASWYSFSFSSFG